MEYELNDQDKELARRLGMQQFQQSQAASVEKPQSGGGLGSFLLGLLPGGSLIDKGLRGQEITGGDVATEAALSLVPFGLGKVARGARGILGGANAARPTLKQRIGRGLERKGSELLGTQANLTRAEARRIGANPAEILGSINRRTGLTRMDDMAEVTKGVTGRDGAFSELTRNAVGNIPGVDIGDIRTMGADILANKAPLVTGLQKDSLLESFKNAGVTMRGGSAGSINPLADPNAALDASRNFRAMASDITKSATVTAKDKQIANVYNDIAKSIEDSIYKSPGIDEGLKLAAPDRAKDLLAMAEKAPNRAQANAYKKLAEELRGVSDVKSLRTAQKDFVDLNKVDEATARAMQGAGAQLGDQMQGLGKIVQRPTNLLAMPLNAATPTVAGLMTKAGRAMQSGQGGSQNKLLSFLAPQAGVRVGADILGLRGQPQEASAIPPELEVGAGSPLGGLAMQGATDLLGGQQSQQSIYSREAAAQDMQNDLMTTGGENMDKYMKLYEFLNPQPTGKNNMNATQATRATAAQNALQDIPMIQEAIASGKIGGLRAIPGAQTQIGRRILGTENLDAALFNIADNILRARTGAAAPEAEVRNFMQSFLPGAIDSTEAQRSKLERAIRELQGYISPYPSSGASTGAEDILALAGA